MPERVGYHLELVNHLTTSEAARRWTETSPKSKLNEINSKLSSTKSNEAKKLKDLISKREYRDFQKEIGIKGYDLDGKLGPRTLDSFNAYLRKIKETTKETYNNNKELHNLQNDVYQDYVHKPEYQQLSESARIHKNSREYLSKHESLSDRDYNRLFSGKEQIAQGQVGNCYMVTALMELANTQYFDTLMKTSISRIHFKDDGLPGFNVRIPLGEPDGRDILIKDYELDTAKIKGNLGYKLLEIAYVKSKRQNNESGNRYYPVSEWEYQNISGGSVEVALSTFLGKRNIGFSNFGTYSIWKNGGTLASASNQQKTQIINHLKNFNGKIGNKFTCLATASSPGGDRESFKVGGNTFWKNHAYALNSVEKTSDGSIAYINVKNPWNNPNKPGGSNSRLTLNEFLLAFSYMGAGKILDTNTFLDNKGGSWA